MTAPSERGKISESARQYITGALSRVLFALGILALGYAGFAFADSQIYQAVEIGNFEQARGPAKADPLADGEMLGEIQILD